MGNLFNPDAPLMQGLSKIADLIVLNLFALVLCLPVVTAGAAITALYDSVWRVIQDEGNAYRAFFRAFKSNFKQATLLWLMVLAAGALLVVCLLFYVSNEMKVLVVVSAALVALWAITTAWIFPLQSRFENKVMTTVKNAALCGLGYLPRSLVMAVLNLLPWGIFLLNTELWLRISFIWIVCWMGLTAYLNLMLIRKPFKKLMGIEEETPAKEEV